MGQQQTPRLDNWRCTILASIDRPTVDHPIKVVVVEDHEITRQGIEVALSKEGDIKVVGEATGSDEAITLINQLRPDVVILDIRLNSGSGVEVGRIARQLSPGSKIVVLTAHDDQEYVRAFACLGASAYLLKDVSGEELCRVVRDAARGWLTFGPLVAPKVLSLLELSGRPGTRTAPEHPLTPKEAEVLSGVSRGLRNAEIAKAMGIAVKTVEAHMESVLLKMGARTRTEAVVMALQQDRTTL